MDDQQILVAFAVVILIVLLCRKKSEGLDTCNTDADCESGKKCVYRPDKDGKSCIIDCTNDRVSAACKEYWRVMEGRAEGLNCSGGMDGPSGCSKDEDCCESDFCYMGQTCLRKCSGDSDCKDGQVCSAVNTKKRGTSGGDYYRYCENKKSSCTIL